MPDSGEAVKMYYALAAGLRSALKMLAVLNEFVQCRSVLGLGF